MHHNRNLQLRGLAFLLVCAALLIPLESITALALRKAPETATAQAVQVQENVTVLTATEATPARTRQATPCTEGYIERRAQDTPVLQALIAAGNGWINERNQRQQVLDILHAHLGTPYVYGGSYPGGFDCSGIVYYIYYRQLGYSISRCADTQFLYDGTPVAQEDLEVGDLVFFRDPSSPWAASHVGIYVGDRMMIHASCTRGLTYDSIDKDYYSSCYVGAKRIISTDNSALTAYFR